MHQLSGRKRCAGRYSFAAYHTLAGAETGKIKDTDDEMTKYEVLTAFAQTSGFLTPDELRIRLRFRPDRRSVYSYLLRLARQGLLERGRTWRGRLTYRLTERGRARLEYLKRQR
jgi:DNA-binding PadR family transcriptional regulator